MKIDDGTGISEFCGVGGQIGLGGSLTADSGASATPVALAWLLFTETGEMGYYMLHSNLKRGFRPLD